MTTYRTDNPVGSTKPKDLYDNAQNLDFLLNGPQPYYADRLGRLRQSWSGMEYEFAKFLTDSGYNDIGDYAAGLTVATRTQGFVRNGVFYVAKADTALPYTLTGNWTTDGPKFKVVGDNSLRQELAAEGGVALVRGAARTLANIAAVRNTTNLAAGAIMFVLSHTDTGDQGGGEYYVDTNDGASADNGGTVLVNSSGQRIKLRHRGTVSVCQFGAGRGSDDSVAFTRACAVGLKVAVPAGQFKLGAATVPLLAGCVIEGAGMEASVITVSGTLDVFTTAVGYTGISGLSFRSDGYRQAGAVFRITAAVRGNFFRNIRSQNQFLTFALSADAVITYLENIEILDATPVTGGGIFIDGGNDTFMRGIVMDAAGPQPRFGLRIQNTQAVWVTDCDFLHAQVPLLIDPTTGDRITWCFFNQVALDQGTSNGIEINVQGTGTCRGLFFTSCWSATNNRGVLIDKASGAQLDLVKFDGCEVMNNSLQGYLVKAGINVTINGGTVAGNGLAGYNTYAGIDFQSGLTGFSAKNVRSGAVAGFAVIQSYGILIGSGCDNYQIVGNDLQGNASGNLADNSASTSVDRDVASNKGARTVNRGIVTIPGGQTSVSVLHGINGVPTAILLSPGGVGIDPYWSNADGVGFLVSIPVAQAGAVQIAWQASIY